MTAAPNGEQALELLKRSLRAEFPEVSSCHMSEAIAFGLGFRTHAALRAEIRKSGTDSIPELLDGERFHMRLAQLGYGDVLVAPALTAAP